MCCHPKSPPVKKKEAKLTTVDWKAAAKDGADLKRLIPDAVGCTLQHVPAKRCFTARYPGASPGSRTRTYGFVFNRVQVLKHVIKWAWSEHKKATGNTPSFAI